MKRIICTILGHDYNRNYSKMMGQCITCTKTVSLLEAEQEGNFKRINIIVIITLIIVMILLIF